LEQPIFDVVIVGAGLVGSSVAAGLRGSGLSIALLDRAAAPEPVSASADDWDVRIYAVSPGSEAFLRGLDAWPQGERIQPVHAMEIKGDAGFSMLRFDASEARSAHLACILESRLLGQVLWQRLRESRDIEIIAPAACSAVEFDPRQANLLLEDDRRLAARLVIAADGADSWVRGQAAIPTVTTAYGQTAVVGNFACERAHRGQAFQWFRSDGVLALLPLPGMRCSLVWSAQHSLAEELLGLSSAGLALRVEEATGDRLGTLTPIGPIAGFPLQLVRVDRLIGPRLALVGDAAHNLHPLAGQGVNLGFQDARELIRVLRERGACADVGEYRLLRRYERGRREDVLAMTAVTDGLERLFGNRSRPLSWLRNHGLSIVNKVGPIKHLLVRHALG
jgi:ubiquinone biosynthesis UbiH/UbiF/VisC/COQ6 family hydroxylase